MRKLRVLLGIAVVVASMHPTHAATFMADTFSYPDGQLTDSLLFGVPGDNVSGGRWDAHSGSTFDDNVNVINGEAELLASGSEDVNRQAGAVMGTGDTWYYAADVTVNDRRANPQSEPLNDDFFIHLRDDGFGFRARTFIQEPNTPSTDTFTFGVAASSDNGSPPAKWASDLTFGTQYTIVQEYDFDSGNVRLWVDPMDFASTSIVDPNPNANSAMTAISSLALRQDFLRFTPSNQILIDNVAIGDNFADVLAALGTDFPVPEPSSIALFALASNVWLLRRRRN